MRARRGFTLIEMLMGTTVAMFTVLAVAAAFIAFTRGVYTQEGIRGGQAGMRQALHDLTRQLRMAGYGLEPAYAFGLPDGWAGSGPNASDRLVVRSRDLMFSASVAQPGGASAGSISVASLPVSLRRGQVLQVVCPGAMRWGYGRLSADVPASNGPAVLPLDPATGTFPDLGAVFDEPCFDGAAGLPARVFKVDVHDYSVRLVDDDGLPGTPPRPYLFRAHGLGARPDAVGEPVAEGIEALRVTFLRENGDAFVPRWDVAHPPPDYETPSGSPLRRNDNPANVRAVRLRLVARASLADSMLREAGMEASLPAMTGETALPAPAGYRRFLYETTLVPRNLRSTEMPLPAYSQDTTTPGACTGRMPADGLLCAGG
ncbi:PilW family protein [Pyxidicoccus caerfyrddinensis]|uniref:PilW family protein n=1 Tax=Pyxidicoccus caerfyrddinensis TaxID=2709663 RepID=UPI001F07F770|nr:PilW family protein [Pyxidicoccus caerfyrddinensis]